MIMKKIIIVFLTIFLAAALWAEKVAVFDDLIKPTGFYLTVNLYDANFKKIKEIFRQPYYFYSHLFIFNLEGKLLKEIDAPIKERSLFSFYPFAIEDGKVFQLLENEDEEWELHVTKIE